MNLLLKDLCLGKTKETVFYYMNNKTSYIYPKKIRKRYKGFLISKLLDIFKL